MECSLEKGASTNLLDNAIQTIHVLRRDGSRIHSITNTVAQNFTANILLACNTKPSMTINPDEVEAFTSGADALHINLGTLDASKMQSIEKSMDIAKQSSMPILLDPVKANVSPLRAEFAAHILDKVDIIKGNINEFKTLGLEKATHSCNIKTGEYDKVLYKDTTVTVTNGHPIMAKVIATGCALGALISALSSKTDCPQTASVAGLIWFGVSGEIAATKSQAPGSFVPYFIDTLYETDLDTLRKHARLS